MQPDQFGLDMPVRFGLRKNEKLVRLTDGNIRKYIEEVGPLGLWFYDPWIFAVEAFHIDEEHFFGLRTDDHQVGKRR